MTDRAEIERLLHMTGRTLEELPAHMILHQSAVIELLVGALRDALAKVPKWISVEERLPEKWQYADGTFVNYLIYMPKYGVDVGNYIQPAKSWVCMGFPTIVTHWMPLPEPPKGDA